MTRKTTQELNALARELPWRDLDREAVQRVRANLRAAALANPPRLEPARDHRRVWAIASVAAVAVFVVAFLIREHPAVVGAAAEPELVRLTDGHIRVRAVERGERPMRVVVGDAEIDARAADFEVYVENDRVVAVFAAAGMVEVRRFGATPIVLQPGVRWEAKQRTFAERRMVPAKKRAPTRRAVISPAPAIEPLIEPLIELPRTPTVAEVSPAEETPPITAAPVVEPKKAVAPEPGNDELHFHKAWVYYQTGHYAEAARMFARVDDGGPWSEDALYWRAHALLRLEPDSNAIPALRAFLTKYPSSPRKGELSVTLGWLLLRSGKKDEARKFFKAASEDPSAYLRESARRGWLEAED